MITYKFNKKTNILEVEILGITSIEDFIKYYKDIGENTNFPNNLKVLSDATKGVFEKNDEVESVKKIVTASKDSTRKRKTVTVAFIVTKPYEVAISQLFQEFHKKKDYRFKLFPTRETALLWLNLISD